MLLTMNLHNPELLQLPGHVLEAITHNPDTQVAHDPQSEFTTQVELPESALLTAEAATHISLLSPVVPTYSSDRQDPQVFGVLRHENRFSLVQLGLWVQFTVLRMDETTEIVCLRLSTLPAACVNNELVKLLTAVTFNVAEFTFATTVSVTLLPRLSNTSNVVVNAFVNSTWPDGSVVVANVKTDLVCTTKFTLELGDINPNS